MKVSQFFTGFPLSACDYITVSPLILKIISIITSKSNITIPPEAKLKIFVVDFYLKALTVFLNKSIVEF